MRGSTGDTTHGWPSPLRTPGARAGRSRGRGPLEVTGRTALVTGASSGIGAAFAEALAARGANVVLTARSVDKLERVAEDLRTRHAVTATVIPADLAAERGADRLVAAVVDAGLDIDILVNNAGFGSHGHFHSLPADRDHDQVMVNVVAPARLTHLLVPAMVRRNWGVVVNIASTSGFQAVPYMAIYGASKAFLLSFSVALWTEYRKHGIRVIGVCPGPTDTNFFAASGTEQTATAFGRLRATEQVVDSTFKALAEDRCHVVDGRGNRLTTWLTRLFPRATMGRVTARVIHPHDDYHRDAPYHPGDLVRRDTPPPISPAPSATAHETVIANAPTSAHRPR